MPGEFFDDRELEGELLDEFPTPLADVFDDLTYQRGSRDRLAKVLDLFRVGVRLLAFYALTGSASEDLPPQALEYLNKLLRQGLTEGQWIGLARETVRPWARTPAPFPLQEVAAVFFRPGTDQPGPGAGVLERLLMARNDSAHRASGPEEEVEALVEQCRPDLEAFIGLLRWMTRAPWFVADPPGAAGGGRQETSGRRLAGATPKRGFKTVPIPIPEPLDTGVVYAIGPAGPLRLGPLVQLLIPPEGEGGEEPELFLLEQGRRREARLQAYPSGREASSTDAQDWLTRRSGQQEETEETGPRFDVPMIGRRAECDEFRRLLQQYVIDDRHGQVLLIEGEAGIGKTKFVRFCREEIAPQRARAMAGAYRGDHAGGAYGGFREALEDLFGVQMLERNAVAARIAERLPELGYDDNAEATDLAAFLTQFLRPTASVGEAVLEGLDYVVGRVGRFLRRASLHVPLLLILEDIHWADAESLAMLHHLGAVLANDPARLMILATMRAGDREPNPALEGTLHKLTRFEGTFHHRPFARLGADDTSTLIEEVLQAQLEDKAAIYRLAGGNPLHVLSILRHLTSEELLETTAEGWRVKRGVQLSEILPATVLEVVGLRVQRLITPDAEGEARRDTLRWAAVAGWRFDAEVLAEAIEEGAPPLRARLDSHLDAFLAAGLLVECPALPGDTLQFEHHLLREVVLAQQEGPRAERARHRCLAAAKLRRVERGDRSLLPEIAHHFLEARQWTEAVQYHKAAGDAARDSLAYREAVGFYEIAVQLLLGQTDLKLTAEERAELYEAQAGALVTLGHREEELAAWRAAQAEAPEDRVRWARIERNVAWLLCLKGQLDEAAAACEASRVVLEEAAAEVSLADVLRTLGVVEIYRGRYEAAMTHLKRAIAIYERGSHLEGLARCYQYLAVHHQQLGDLEAMLEAVQQSRAISEELGHPISVAKALANVAYVLTLLGRHNEALPLLLRTAETFEKHHIEESLPSVYHSLAEALLKCNRDEEACQYAARGLESARRIGELRTVADFHQLLARHAASAGRVAEARSQFEEALRVCADTDFEPQQAQICLEFGGFLSQIGERDEAIRLCEEALVIRRRLGSEGVAEAEAAVARAREATSAAVPEIRHQVPAT